MWQITQEQWKALRPFARDAAHIVLFLVALAFLIVGGLVSAPADLSLIGAAMGILAVIGIARA